MIISLMVLYFGSDDNDNDNGNVNENDYDDDDDDAELKIDSINKVHCLRQWTMVS